MVIKKYSTSHMNNADEAFTELLSLLIESARAISGGLSAKELSNIIVDEARRVFSANSVWLLIYDPLDDILKMDHYWGPGEETFKGFSIKPGSGIPGKVFETRKPKIIFKAGLSLTLVSSEKVSDEEILVLAAFPLAVGDRKIGVFGISSEKIGRIGLSEAEINFLVSAFANHIATAIDTANLFAENARLYQEQVETKKKIEAYVEQLKMLNNLSQNIIEESNPQKMVDRLAEAACVLLDCSDASVLLYSETGDNYLACSRLDGDTGYGKAVDFDFSLKTCGGLYGEVSEIKGPIRIADGPAQLAARKNSVEQQSNFRGPLGAPLLCSSGKFLGQVMVADKRDGSNFSKTDEELLVALCSQVAIGIEKALVYEQERNVAEVLQQAILATPRRLQGIEVGITYESAAEVAKVGGDFYDLFDLGDGKIGILVGDVSGKGLEAATITSMVKSTIRAFAYKGYSPAAVLSETNMVISRQLDSNQFVTMVYGALDLNTGKLVFSRAGHPEVIIWREDGCSFRETESNLPLGIFDEVLYDENEVNLSAGDGVILYTDGLIETRFENQLLGDDMLIDELNRITPGKSPQEIAFELVDMVKRYTGGQPQDDMAVVIFRIK